MLRSKQLKQGITKWWSVAALEQDLFELDPIDPIRKLIWLVVSRCFEPYPSDKWCGLGICQRENGQDKIHQSGWWMDDNLSGWWLTYHSEKYDFVNWDDNSQYVESHKKCSEPPTSNIENPPFLHHWESHRYFHGVIKPFILMMSTPGSTRSMAWPHNSTKTYWYCRQFLVVPNSCCLPFPIVKSQICLPFFVGQTRVFGALFWRFFEYREVGVTCDTCGETTWVNIEETVKATYCEHGLQPFAIVSWLKHFDTRLDVVTMVSSPKFGDKTAWGRKVGSHFRDLLSPLSKLPKD